MITAREEILESIRRALGREGALEPSIASALSRRLKDCPPHVQPVLAGQLTECFVAKLETVNASVDRVEAPGNIAQAVEAYLSEHELAECFAAGSGDALREVVWPGHLTLEHRAATRNDRIALSEAFLGVAETGSLVFVSSVRSPTTLNFLPEHHIAVVRVTRLVRHLEDAWRLLRQELATVPRTVNFITGPSKTADVEQTIEYGAHGPRRLHVIVVAT